MGDYKCLLLKMKVPFMSPGYLAFSKVDQYQAQAVPSVSPVDEGAGLLPIPLERGQPLVAHGVLFPRVGMSVSPV